MARMDDGHPTTIEIDGMVLTMIETKEVTPPGVSGGGENDTTTMENSTWRTRSPKTLKTLSECSLTVAYDPVIFDTIAAKVNVNSEITITFPDSSTLIFWGWIDEFTPGACSEGEQPTADITIIPSNQNDSLVETGPTYSS